MSGRGCLSVVCGVATVIAMVVLLLPVSIPARSYQATETVSCGMPLGPRFERSAEIDATNAQNGERTDYHDQCNDRLATRRTWAIPVGLLMFVVALSAAAAAKKAPSEPSRNESHHGTR